VVARLAGTGSGKALLLMAHYDSRGTAPGASDDGYGVASLLETARALTTSPPLTSDIIFLFTDGEEDGLLGAQAFVSSHRWAAHVGVVLNFEARGNAGPVLMFQTSDDNGALVRQLARAAPHPVASSLSQAVY
jgi:Zn-dependent M28 family amino/carboxypeptidase